MMGVRTELAAILIAVPQCYLHRAPLLLYVVRPAPAAPQGVDRGPGLRRHYHARGYVHHHPAARLSPLNAIAFRIFAFALLRYGLLAAIVASATGQILELAGSLDFSTWYVGMAAMPVVAIVLLAAY